MSTLDDFFKAKEAIRSAMPYEFLFNDRFYDRGSHSTDRYHAQFQSREGYEALLDVQKLPKDIEVAKRHSQTLSLHYGNVPVRELERALQVFKERERINILPHQRLG